MIGIADTGFLIAFSNRRDRYFPWAYALAQQLSGPLLTCEAVLAETAFHLKDSELVMKMIEKGLIKISFNANRHIDEIQKLARRYADRRPDFADLCLIRMSELFQQHPIITVDNDFKIYRRNRRKIIPVLMPHS